MGWKAAARNTRLGPWVELDTLAGYKVRPHKFSSEVRAELTRLQLELLPADVRTLVRKLDAQEGETFEEAIARLPGEDQDRIIAAMVERSTSTDVVRRTCIAGIGDHNFDDEDGQHIEWGPDLVDAIMEQCAEAADEIAAIAAGWNRPLAGRSSDDSTTSLTISTTGSPTTEECSPTEQTQESS